MAEGRISVGWGSVSIEFVSVETTEVVDTLDKHQGDILEVVFARFRESQTSKQFHDDLYIFVKAVKRMFFRLFRHFLGFFLFRRFPAEPKIRTNLETHTF